MTPPQPEWKYKALEDLGDRVDDKHDRTNKRIDKLEIELTAWRDEIRRDFVSRHNLALQLETVQERYAPVVRIVYGLFAAIGIGVVGAVLALVLKR